MKVLNVIDHMGSGGAQKLLFIMLERSKSNDWCGYSLRALPEGVNALRFSAAPVRSKYSLMPFFHLRTFLKGKEVKILHCHLIKAQLVGWLIKLFFKPDVKLVFHEHGGLFAGKWWYVKLYKVMRRRVDMFIAVSENAGDEMMRLASIPREKIRVIENFLTVDIADTPVDRVMRQNDRGFNILFVGRINRVKGWDLLLNAVARLDIPFTLTVAGDGPDTHKLKEMVKTLKLEEQVKLLGYVTDLDGLYANADVAVIPSRSESFGLSFHEARAFGVATIASDLWAFRAFSRNGEDTLSFRSGDVSDLVEKIGRLYADPQLRDRIGRVGQNVSKKFTYDRFELKLSQLYNELLADEK